ncbi:Hsp70 family protein [Sporolactobacillus vineae]|uniref:Hsp70 family protein n=1 Tax=Sporolactobacillus vineae TaxID=444463 RepID=UPI000288E0E3|nr:Hsp70 family protein [Sporolactobacillus vineae]
MSLTLGIDLGTTNSALAIYEDGEPKILENKNGNRVTPSVVSFKDGEIIVGEPAKNQLAINPNTFASIKRHMGEPNYTVQVNETKYSPEEISSEILKYLKEVAEQHTGETINKAIITVPAYFNDDQRTATKKAGELAGLKVERVLNEPTAAAIAFGANKKTRSGSVNILVYDLGGGTFDVSILQLEEGIYEVLATDGDNKLGGDDFDLLIVKWINAQIKSEFNIDLTSDKRVQIRLKEEAEKAKKSLSAQTKCEITIPFLSINPSTNIPINFESTLTRETFNDLIQDLVQRTEEPVKKALELAKISLKDIDLIVMNGGSTRIPYVQDFVRKITHKPINFVVNPDEAVAIGAAILGESLSDMSGSDSNAIDLVDVTPMSLGIEIVNDGFSVLIPRNTPIPYTNSGIYHTTQDNQTMISSHIAQGESEKASENYVLGLLEIPGLPPLPAGQAQIEVTFILDANGILTVKGKNMENNNVVKVVINKEDRMGKFPSRAN